MARDFTAIRTEEEAHDALRDARVVDFAPGKAFFTLEAVSGERFTLAIDAPAYKVTTGREEVTVRPNLILTFGNAKDS